MARGNKQDIGEILMLLLHHGYHITISSLPEQDIVRVVARHEQDDNVAVFGSSGHTLEEACILLDDMYVKS